MRDGLANEFPTGVVPVTALADMLTSLLWNVGDEQLQLLNGVLTAISNDNNEVSIDLLTERAQYCADACSTLVHITLFAVPLLRVTSRCCFCLRVRWPNDTGAIG